ncbi:MAG: hypothetical protein HN712_02140 [Gemmatimonadetes bacterium]|nr:hypothetical protein [Gemmatimonadota bacterium]MBT6143877.1 hypothetical protein [Gemmatimonadota bacterium]MBT7859075.1 hypothetical protein [Gemmatimonadota bacterium]
MFAPNLQTLRSLSTRSAVALFLLAWAVAQPAAAWWGSGHDLLAQASVQALPQDMPDYFRAGASTIAHMSYDPDVAKNRGTPQLSHGEFPEHFFDLELLADQPYPDKRYEFIELCHELGVAPDKVGFAPYAIAEWTQRLAVAFAEHRRWPENEAIRAKSLVYAGFLAHYSQDLVQPLHATIHYDGRVDEDGRSPHSGIHETVDASVERLKLDPAQLAREAQVIPIDGDLFEAIRSIVRQSNGLVDEVYGLATDLEGGSGPTTEAGRQFVRERAVRATAFTASLYVTAWQLSEDLRLPGWLDR